MGQASENDELADLKERCLEGEEAAWEALYDRFYRYAWVVADRSGANTNHEKDDIAQEALFALTRRLDEVRNIKGYVRRVVKNKCADAVNAYKKDDTVSIEVLKSGAGEDEESAGVDFEDDPQELVEHEVVLHIRDAVQNMGERCRELLKGRYFEELSYKEVGKEVGLPTNQVGTYLGRCLDRLRDSASSERPQLWDELTELEGDVRYEL